MTDEMLSTLVRLDDTDLTLEVPSDDLRGRHVVDRNGDELGDVDGLIIDEDRGPLQLLRLRAVLGPGLHLPELRPVGPYGGSRG